MKVPKIEYRIDRVDCNRYRPRKLYLLKGLASIIDGLVLLCTFGSYQTGFSTDLSVQILYRAMILRRKERENKNGILEI